MGIIRAGSVGSSEGRWFLRATIRTLEILLPLSSAERAAHIVFRIHFHALYIHVYNAHKYICANVYACVRECNICQYNIFVYIYIYVYVRDSTRPRLHESVLEITTKKKTPMVVPFFIVFRFVVIFGRMVMIIILY